VAVSRGRYDAQLYTNDAAKRSKALSRDVSKHAALDISVNRIHVQGAQFAVKQPSPSNVPQGEQVGRAQAHGQSVGQGGDLRGNRRPHAKLRRLSPASSCRPHFYLTGVDCARIGFVSILILSTCLFVLELILREVFQCSRQRLTPFMPP
jgi:hypothetical protein